MKYKVGDEVVCIKYPIPSVVGQKGFIYRTNESLNLSYIKLPDIGEVAFYDKEIRLLTKLDKVLK